MIIDRSSQTYLRPVKLDPFLGDIFTCSKHDLHFSITPTS